MDVNAKVLELLCKAPLGSKKFEQQYYKSTIAKIADHLITHGVTVQESARPLEEWHEDYGDVLWWKFPIEEPPYVGSPLDEKFPAYHTHWTPIVIPQPPKGE